MPINCEIPCYEFDPYTFGMQRGIMAAEAGVYYREDDEDMDSFERRIKPKDYDWRALNETGRRVAFPGVNLSSRVVEDDFVDGYLAGYLDTII
jgi:hypothetical protein